jgi:peptidyl-prolyl cis-trans isomerase SurA
MNFWIKSANSLIIFAGAVILFCNTAYGETFDRVVARVNGDIIILSAVQEKATFIAEQVKARQGSLPDNMSGDELLASVLNDMVDEKLQLQEARKTLMEVDERRVEKAIADIKGNNNITEEQLEEMLEQEGKSIESYKKQVRDQILVSQIIGYRLKTSAVVSDKEIHKYYLKNQKEFWKPEKSFFRHILFIFEPGISDKEKRFKTIKAKEVLRQIKAGKSFEDLAIKYSEDVSSSSGGEIGYIAKGTLVAELEDVAFKLKEGKVSGLVKSDYGLHIIKNDHIVSASLKPFEDVKDEIGKHLFSENRKVRYDKWMKSLKKNAFIETFLFEPKKSLQKKKTQRLAKPLPRGKNKSSVRGHKKSDPFFEEWEEADLRKNSETKILPSDFKSMEKKLSHIKDLLEENKISESEYHDRKKQLLDQL